MTLDSPPDPIELTVDPKTGLVRQAGASMAEGEFVQRVKAQAEADLYTFAVSILGLTRMTKRLHLPVTRWLMHIPPYRKLLLLPRDHLKTSMMRALETHMLLQPAERNPYFPGKDGSTTRVLLANETATNAMNQLRWIAGQFESNPLIRAFWPHRCWENARKQSKKWAEEAITLPRPQDFPEASIETIGVGGAVTGRHYDVLVKDDLISVEAMNSAVVMQGAIEWHKTSRALLDDPNVGLEFIIGTRWAVYDLYQDILDNDPSVEPLIRMAIEDGEPIFPEIFNLNALAQLSRELGPMFPLLYMNTPYDPSLVDFDLHDIRTYEAVGQVLRFATTEHDQRLAERYAVASLPLPPVPQGTVLNSRTYESIFRGRHIRRGRAA
ncbi:MAG: hypothetical protein C4555_06380 [Dehalococcoidia bacterium]|nr:MAG: hypothetical protein C4555_06380 [Dehalococcoidia bacterium]